MPARSLMLRVAVPVSRMFIVKYRFNTAENVMTEAQQELECSFASYELRSSKFCCPALPRFCAAILMFRRFAAACTLLLVFSINTNTDAADLKLLFMGDNGHHQPARRFQELASVLAKRGVQLKYTDRMEDLNTTELAKYDGLVLYANIDRIEDAQADAVLEYVAGGNGFIPLHCATYCWRNNADMVALMGAQFKRHGGRVFATQIVNADHPIMKGFDGFTSWDETYVHHLHNEKNRMVLERRFVGTQAEGNASEPWTWVRTHGKGRVFYTAWGHDGRTFQNSGFHNLVERGIRWACGDDPGLVPALANTEAFSNPGMTKMPTDNVLPFEYVDVGPKIPNYTPGQRWGVQGKPKNMMQKPLSVEESMRHFVTPVGMRVKRYADERSFNAKPIAMTWDERGRLWICETVDYPNELGKDRDRIRICEDTDGDDVADKFTVFAEGLTIPTAIVIHRGGAVVQSGTETIYLKDTDGDDVADEKTTLISGWAMGDTHGGVSNFRYGLDNWIWAMQGYNNSRPKFNGKVGQNFRQGFWRFKLSQTDPPKVTDLEFIRSSDNNTWGLGISEEGLIFGSTANHNPSMFVPIPNRYYEKVLGWAPLTMHSIADTYKFNPVTEKVRQVDQFGGYTAGAGHALYTARAFPQQWWNKTAFVCGPTGHLVGTFVLRRDGANYRSNSPMNLLASDDEWSAPIMAEVGPDGAVWVLDWYNYIIQHNPTPQGFKTGKGNAYASDLRDKKHGRIYRVVNDNLHDYSSLADSSNSELVGHLKHPSFVWRLQAQRLLIERKAHVLGDLIKLVADRSVDPIGLNVGAIHALQTLKGLGYVGLSKRLIYAHMMQRCLTNGLTHPSAGVRRNAISVLPTDPDGLALLLNNRQLFTDDDVQVSLQAILTLADMPPTSEAGGLIAQLAADEKDPVLIDALTAAAATHSVPFLVAITNKDAKQSDATRRVTNQIAQHVARSRLDAQSLQEIVASLAGSDVSIAAGILDGIVAGLPADFSIKNTPALDGTFVSAFEKLDSAAKVKLMRVTSLSGSKALDVHAKEIVKSLMNVIADDGNDMNQRAAAARDAIGFANDRDVVQRILDQIGPQTQPELSSMFLDSIRGSDADGAGLALIDSARTFTPKLKAAAIDVLLSKPVWVGDLLTAIEKRKFDLDDLSLEQKQALRAFPDEKLRSQAEKLLAIDGGLPDVDREKVLQSLMHLTKKAGDVEAGAAVFKKVCAACHKHGDMGKQIGPNLTGMSVHPKAELLTHIIDPSRSVEGNFRLYKVLTDDGTVISGMLASETRTSFTIIDSKGKENRVAREDVEELVASRKSVMPEGFEKQIDEQQLTDLLEFLADKGRFVPLVLDRYATAISTKGLFSNGDNGPDRMVFASWKPKVFKNIPFALTDPQGKTRPNIILLNGPFGPLPPKMPKVVTLPCNMTAKAIHLLSGVGGWNHPYDTAKTVSMIVRFQYEDGETEDHKLINGIHFADYIRRVDVAGSEFAYMLGGQQVRYLSVKPSRSTKIKSIDLVKGKDNSAPIVMAVTIER